MRADADIKHQFHQIKIEQAKQKSQQQLIDDFYQGFLNKKNPSYPQAQKKIIDLGLEPDQTSDEANLLLLEKQKAKLQDQLKISEEIQNEDQKQELEQLKLGSQKVNTLDKLDLLQAETLIELEFYNKQQTYLKNKLDQQERLLCAVTNDINKRSALVSYVITLENDAYASHKRSTHPITSSIESPVITTSEPTENVTRQNSNKHKLINK